MTPQQQIEEVLKKLHDGGFPSAIVAGGAIRDIIFGKPVKDIDVFVGFEDIASRALDPIGYFSQSLDRVVDKEDWSSYMNIPDVLGVYSVLNHYGELPVQIIVMEQGLSPVQRVNQLDWGFCQAYSTGNRAYWYTKSFAEDFNNGTITLVYCESQHEFNRSIVRYERLKQKYPEFKLVIPEEFREFSAIKHLGDCLTPFRKSA